VAGDDAMVMAMLTYGVVWWKLVDGGWMRDDNEHDDDEDQDLFFLPWSLTVGRSCVASTGCPRWS
jgi:hypothetical protein